MGAFVPQEKVLRKPGSRARNEFDVSVLNRMKKVRNWSTTQNLPLKVSKNKIIKSQA